MYKKDSRLILSPSDLTRFMESEFITWMDRYNLEFPGELTPDEDSDTDKMLQKKGLAHEAEFLAHLKSQGLAVYDAGNAQDKFAATIEAMKEGVEVIYQGALCDDEFAGYADFLVKVKGVTSSLGDYYYEPWDTKLALSTKAYFLTQLACYGHMLAKIQEKLPAHMHVVLGNKVRDSYRMQDFFYYYKQLRQALLQQQNEFDAASPPDFMGMEKFGRWTTHAEKIMERKDHLCRVANIRTVQIRKLYTAGISTMTDLAKTSLTTIAKMQDETFSTLKHQAQLQVDSIGRDIPLYEVITPHREGYGLTILPPQTAQDIYFDMEGFPGADGGLEYLFGATITDNGNTKFIDWWAHNSEEEKRAFEEFIDFAYARFQENPMMHIYHYASYEKTALRKLMGRYGTREKELDALLRNEVFVDLFAVLRQGLRVGTPNYSIKSIELIYRGKRKTEVATATDSIVFYQRWLDEQDGTDWTTSNILKEIRDYNKDDCDSTLELANWLRKIQKENAIAWRGKEFKEEPQSARALKRKEAGELAMRMLRGIPLNESELNERQKISLLLAHLLEFHWREAKPVFWAQYDRHDMTEQELFDDPGCLSGLVRDNQPPQPIAKSLGYSYNFDPSQDTKIDADNECFYAHDLRQTIMVASIDVDNGKVILKRGNNGEAPPPNLSLIKNEFVKADDIENSIFRTAEAYAEGKSIPSALEDFLLRRRPRIAGSPEGPLLPPGKTLTEGTADVISRMRDTTLCIQGPPGGGKTYTAAYAITELIRQGKRVGVASNSHKSIAHLMDKVAKMAEEKGISLRGAKVQSETKNFHVTASNIEAMVTQKFLSMKDRFQLIGGTAWLFSKEGAVDLIDYLFVDEAGQVSVANLVGMSPSTKNIVVIGDQMQLSQPMQGTHPGDSGQSILQYLLQDTQVIPDHFGIFLGTSWRMHPDVCSFISGAIYEDRLGSEPHTEKRMLEITPGDGQVELKASGILYVPVEHEGNAQDSEEEASAIQDIVKQLLQCSFNDGTMVRPLTLYDILIVAPYNMQVRRLRALLPGAKVGTVDKFQGQEAPVVIVSMCSSTGDASSRGLEFIFSKNRLNVAISRAQSLAIVIGSPALARTHCRNVDQMELVNLFCRIVETGSKIPVLATAPLL